jgi:hypothetical protein
VKTTFRGKGESRSSSSSSISSSPFSISSSFTGSEAGAGPKSPLLPIIKVSLRGKPLAPAPDLFWAGMPARCRCCVAPVSPGHPRPCASPLPNHHTHVEAQVSTHDSKVRRGGSGVSTWVSSSPRLSALGPWTSPSSRLTPQNLQGIVNTVQSFFSNTLTIGQPQQLQKPSNTSNQHPHFPKPLPSSLTLSLIRLTALFRISVAGIPGGATNLPDQDFNIHSFFFFDVTYQPKTDLNSKSNKHSN